MGSETWIKKNEEHGAEINFKIFMNLPDYTKLKICLHTYIFLIKKANPWIWQKIICLKLIYTKFSILLKHTLTRVCGAA